MSDKTMPDPAPRGVDWINFDARERVFREWLERVSNYMSSEWVEEGKTYNDELLARLRDEMKRADAATMLADLSRKAYIGSTGNDCIDLTAALERAESAEEERDSLREEIRHAMDSAAKWMDAHNGVEKERDELRERLAAATAQRPFDWWSKTYDQFLKMRDERDELRAEVADHRGAASQLRRQCASIDKSLRGVAGMIAYEGAVEDGVAWLCAEVERWKTQAEAAAGTRDKLLETIQRLRTEVERIGHKNGEYIRKIAAFVKDDLGLEKTPTKRDMEGLDSLLSYARAEVERLKARLPGEEPVRMAITQHWDSNGNYLGVWPAVVDWPKLAKCPCGNEKTTFRIMNRQHVIAHCPKCESATGLCLSMDSAARKWKRRCELRVELLEMNEREEPEGRR